MTSLMHAAQPAAATANAERRAPVHQAQDPLPAPKHVKCWEAAQQVVLNGGKHRLGIHLHVDSVHIGRGHIPMVQNTEAKVGTAG